MKVTAVHPTTDDTSTCLQNRKSTPLHSFQHKSEGVAHEDGVKIPEELSGGLANELELCEGARVLSTSNVWVSAGIMNGTAGTIRAIVYRRGDRPDHEDVRRRLPYVILVECPQFTGTPFFDLSQYLERRQWVFFSLH